MRHYPEESSDREELAKLQPPDWMVETLRFNPEYCYWGPHEDYMWKEGEGWDSRIVSDSWTAFGPWTLDTYNECAHFYFEINRPSEDCPGCNGTGNHPDAQWITESWYRHSSPFTVPDGDEIRAKAVMERFGCQFKPSSIGRGTLPPDDVLNRYGKPFLEHCVSAIDNGGSWDTAVTQDETDALWEEGRFMHEFAEKPTAAAVNERARKSAMTHDAINRWICCKRRCERLGVPYYCEICDGDSRHFTGDAYLSLVLWILHPRKGCSRGVEVKNIMQEELPDVFAWLQTAATRNAERFAKIPATASDRITLAGTRRL